VTNLRVKLSSALALAIRVAAIRRKPEIKGRVLIKVTRLAGTLQTRTLRVLPVKEQKRHFEKLYTLHWRLT
jgi:hypothetical protein